MNSRSSMRYKHYIDVGISLSSKCREIKVSLSEISVVFNGSISYFNIFKKIIIKLNLIW